MGRRQDGQIFPLMAALMLTVLALGFAFFQIARASVQRSEAQTAADAAALAGARNAKQQLDAMMASGGYADPQLVNPVPVIAAVESYAAKNDAVVVGRPEIQGGVDVKVRVKTKAQLGKDASRFDSEAVRGSAKARARVELSTDGTSSGGSAPTSLSGGGGGGGASGDGDGTVSGKEWDTFQKDELDDKKPTCTDAGSSNDVIKVGEFLADHGFQIGENSHFGPVDMDVHANGSYHYRCGNAGALDVNFDGKSKAEKAAIDPLIEPLNKLGYKTIWQAAGHFDHMHIDSGTGSIGPGGDSGGGFGFGDQTMEVKLIDWDAAFEELQLLGGGPGPQVGAGPPDPDVARSLCRSLDKYDATPIVRLATFETAIVESGVRNLSGGDRDSAGVFQQRPSQSWGSYDQVTNVQYSAMKFITEAQKHLPWSDSAGMLAFKVQACAWEYRFRYDENRDAALAMIEKYC